MNSFSTFGVISDKEREQALLHLLPASGKVSKDLESLRTLHACRVSKSTERYQGAVMMSPVLVLHII